MGVVAAVARAELRQRWRVLLLLGLLAGLAGGVTLGALAGARRTSTAFDRSVEATHPGDVTVRGFASVVSQVPDFPEVERSWRARLTVGKVLDAPSVVYLAELSGPPPPPDLFTPEVVAGRLPRPDRADEVAVSQDFAEFSGLGPGDSLDLKLLTDDDLAHFGSFGEPGGGTVHIEIVGTVRVTGTSAGDVLSILGPPAYYEAHRNGGGADIVMADLRRGNADVPAVRHRLQSVLAAHPPADDNALPPYEVFTPQQERVAATHASRVVVLGLLLLAATAAAAGVVAIVQAAGLFAARRRPDQEILASLGVPRGQRRAAAALPVACVSAPIAAVVAIAVAVAGSSFSPVGFAERFEPHPGLELNWVICGVGALLVGGLLTVAVALVVTRRRPHRRALRTRPSTAEQLGRAGVRPPAAVGAQFALEPGRGRTSVPVRSTLLAAVVGVAGIIAAATYGGSFHRVLHEPSRYGYPADLEIVDAQEAQVAPLTARPDVAAVADVYSVPVAVGGTDGVAFGVDDRKGIVGPTMLAGRRPATKDEVALGPALASGAHVGVGDTVSMRRIGGGERTLTVVGIELMNGDTSDDFDRTAALTIDGLRAYGGTPTRTAYVRFQPGTDVEAQRAALGKNLEIDGPSPPSSVVSVEQLERLPTVLAGFFALIAVIALINAAGTALVRRRRDIAVLRAMGFTPRQSGRVLLGMVTTTAMVGIGAGVPLGVLIGRLLWRAVADGMGVAPAVVAPLAAAGLAAAGALVVANLVGLVPAALAARRTVAVDLRSE